ncbi:MAG: hypothetical protein DLM54_03880 [Acidimicrobiales bacterium]|nr:MAG: hypothetical protein DLM54_03880 [Acidimicrobiales bacterium]
MSEIVVSPLGAGAYRVEVREGSRISHHQVEVPDGFADGLVPGADAARIVQESFAFLLEREPATSILANFALPVIGDYFPEYRSELSRRLR